MQGSRDSDREGKGEMMSMPTPVTTWEGHVGIGGGAGWWWLFSLREDVLKELHQLLLDSIELTSSRHLADRRGKAICRVVTGSCEMAVDGELPLAQRFTTELSWARGGDGHVPWEPSPKLNGFLPVINV